MTHLIPAEDVKPQMIVDTKAIRSYLRSQEELRYEWSDIKEESEVVKVTLRNSATILHVNSTNELPLALKLPNTYKVRVIRDKNLIERYMAGIAQDLYDGKAENLTEWIGENLATADNDTVVTLYESIDKSCETPESQARLKKHQQAHGWDALQVMRESVRTYIEQNFNY